MTKLTTGAKDVTARDTYREAREEASNQVSWDVDPLWSDAEKLSLACRILVTDGHDSILPGLVAVRTSKPGEFLTLPIGLGFDEVTPDLLLTVDENLSVLHGTGQAAKAVGFLIKMMELRPDVNCGIHTHALYTSALSMLGEELAVAHMDATMFHDDCAFLKDWPGNPVSETEGEIISEALQHRRAILLANHGLATVDATIEGATFLAFAFERAAMMQIRARAIGPLTPINPELAAEAHDYMAHPSMTAVHFRRLARRVLRQAPDCLD
jgi:L-fuculose-phosphate aldolase